MYKILFLLLKDGFNLCEKSMKQIVRYSTVIIPMLLFQGCGTTNNSEMSAPKFIEIVVQNHMVLHGFDKDNKEIIEEVELEKPMKKLIRVDRIQSVSEKYILTSYGYGRLVYWEYDGSYEDIRDLLVLDDNR